MAQYLGIRASKLLNAVREVWGAVNIAPLNEDFLFSLLSGRVYLEDYAGTINSILIVTYDLERTKYSACIFTS